LTCSKCYLCKDNVKIDFEIASKIKWALTDSISDEYQGEIKDVYKDEYKYAFEH